MPRYAVLHDITGEDSRPAGLAVEMGDHVLVHVADGYGMPERQAGEYRVLQPDATFVTYRPGDSGYFDQVLVDVGWAFGVGEQGVVEDVTDRTLLDLWVSKVDCRRRREGFGEYGLRISGLEQQPEGRLRLASSQYLPVPADERQVQIAARGDVVV